MCTIEPQSLLPSLPRSRHPLASVRLPQQSTRPGLLKQRLALLGVASLLIIVEAPVARANASLNNTIETILLHQRSSGGWPKNYDRDQSVTKEDQRRLLARQAAPDATFDNGATHEELRILARAMQTMDDDRLLAAFQRGLDFTLDAQYENGGWPQGPGSLRDYRRHITFNDGAMIGVLSLLTDVAQRKSNFDFVDEPRRLRCERAVALGIQCILACQIRQGHQKKAWCAQHDEVTFAPRGARSYELPSVSGFESVGIIRYLMTIKQPSPEVIDAITTSVEWFESSKLHGIRLDRIQDPNLPGGRDRVIVADDSAPPLWARFYDLETNKPIFCSRDGVPRQQLTEISHERRNGYSWVGNYAGQLLETEYPAWRKSLSQPACSDGL